MKTRRGQESKKIEEVEIDQGICLLKMISIILTLDIKEEGMILR